MARLNSFKPATQNANKHTKRGMSSLEKAIRSVGYTEPMVAAADGEMLSGSARLETCADVFGADVEPIIVESDGTRPVIHVRRDIPNAHTPAAQAIAVQSNRIAELDLNWDVETLAQMPADVLEGLWQPEELEKLGDLWAEDHGPGSSDGEEDSDEAEPALDRHDIPDALWATDNAWGVPLLDMHWQANAVDLPVEAWGSKGSRNRRQEGTYHFYTEDYRFTALWADPSPVVNSGCINVVEPNFSCYRDMPPAVALYRIYQKRWLARYWQSMGIRVFVDLNVAEPHAALNLLGVPQGWRAWATRGYVERMDATEREYELACERAGTDDILFMCYGGGKAVRELCQRRGWVHVIEQRDAAKSPVVSGAEL
jgi:hypothetical protein